MVISVETLLSSLYFLLFLFLGFSNATNSIKITVQLGIAFGVFSMCIIAAPIIYMKCKHKKSVNGNNRIRGISINILNLKLYKPNDVQCTSYIRAERLTPYFLRVRSIKFVINQRPLTILKSESKRKNLLSRQILWSVLYTLKSYRTANFVYISYETFYTKWRP